MKSTLNERYDKIYVTGATGWVGKTFLHELQSIVPADQFNKKVTAFGSKRRELKSTNYRKENDIVIPIHPLTELEEHSAEKNILIFHSAFLTKDRISKYGISEYTRINKFITETVSEFIKRGNISRVVGISSGAASIVENSRRKENMNDELDHYGWLKLSEERNKNATIE